MRVLYLTNYHNPYRDEFFEQLGRRCNLTVLFEQRADAARDASWFEGVEARSYQEVYLPEGECGPVSPTMLKTVIVGRGAPVATYPFSSFTGERARELVRADAVRDSRLVLVVGQYKDYKGLDVMLGAIPTLSDGLCFHFVGMGKKADEFRALVEAKGLSDDVEVVPFLKPDDLAAEYLRAGLLVLPSRQECWGARGERGGCVWLPRCEHVGLGRCRRVYLARLPAVSGRTRQRRVTCSRGRRVHEQARGRETGVLCLPSSEGGRIHDRGDGGRAHASVRRGGSR